MTEISQEDKKAIDNLFDKLEAAFTTGTEVTLTKIGDCVSKMPIDDLRPLGGLVKKYGYYGAFLAIQQSIEQRDLGSVGKYALGTGIAVLLIPATYGILSTTLLACTIGVLVDLSWDYIEEHKDDIFNKLKSMLAEAGLEIEENGNFKVNLDLVTEYHSSYVNPMFISSLKELYGTAEVTRSPLVVDLDGDGVETVGVSEGVYFDHDGNGFAEKSGWVGKDDGILVRDINNNGTIDNGTELFGNNSVLSSGENALNGFEALKELDSNKDGVFNSSDEAWNTVKVWKDSNQNGIVDNSELLSLEQANIAGINLNYNEQELVDGNGNTHAQTGTIIKTDGSSGTITDVWFDADTADTIDQAEVIIPDDIKSLPDVSGFGNVHSLQAAMALDESGELKALVEQFMSETNVSARNALLNDIIYHWAGVEDMDPFGRTPSRYNGTHYLDDARKLEALEEFMGRGYLGTWCWGERDPNPNRHAVLFIHDAFDELKEYVKNELLSQTHYKTLLEKVTLTYDAATESWDIDVSQAVAAFEEMFAADVLNTTLVMREFSEIIRTYTDLGDEIIAAFNLLGDEYGDIFERELFKFGKSIGTDGNDIIKDDDFGSIITGLGGNDELYGGAGDDNLYGGNGDDILFGGAGNDDMNGEDGRDIYLYNLGDGLDTIYDGASSKEEGDIIRFGEGISLDDITFETDGSNLKMILNGDETQGLILRSFFNTYDDNAKNKVLEFADGSQVMMNKRGYELVMTKAGSLTATNYDDIIHVTEESTRVWGKGGNDIIYGGAGDDDLRGEGGNDELYGGAGDDNLYGGNGDDILFGGAGNDDMNGEDGRDIYLYNLGDGLDTIYDGASSKEEGDIIRFGEGISLDDITFETDGSNLKMILNGDETQGLILRSFFNTYDDNAKNKVLEFADGTKINLLTNPPSFSSQNASDLLTQALSTFGADSGSRTDISEAGGTVSEMYDLACGYDLTKKTA